MPIIYFSHCPWKNSDNTTLFKRFRYQVFRYFIERFTFTGSTNCSKDLCSKWRIQISEGLLLVALAILTIENAKISPFM